MCFSCDYLFYFVVWCLSGIININRNMQQRYLGRFLAGECMSKVRSLREDLLVIF